MQKIKIMNIQSRIVIGGPAHITILLSKQLQDNKIHTVLVGGNANDDEKSIIDNAKNMGIDCKIITEMGREIHFYDDFLSLIKLFFLIRREKPDIIHTHTAKAGAIGRISAFFAGVPLIYHTYHGHVFEGYFGKTISRLYVFIEKFLAKISTKIIVISSAQNYDIVHKFKIAQQDKVVEIPLGFDWDNILKSPKKIELRKKFKISKEKFLIGIVGRIVPIKNHHLFIEIAEQLIQHNYSSFHFVIIGDGELRTNIEQLIGYKGLTFFFTFTGWLKGIQNIYDEMDLLLLTSKNEGTPVAILEALAKGVPVVASDVGGVKDIFEKYNPKHLVEDNDIEQYVKLILEIKNSNYIVKEKIRSSVMSYYSSENVIDNIKNLYYNDLKKINSIIL